MTVSSNCSIERPTVESTEQAEMWIGIYHTWGVKNAERMNRIENRLARLERTCVATPAVREVTMVSLARAWQHLMLAVMTIPALPLAVVVVVLNIVHPLVHGTPLDSGALDVLIANLTAATAVVACDPHTAIKEHHCDYPS